MAFFNSAVQVLQTLVIALGSPSVWGGINLMEGYGGDNPGAKSQGMKQLMAGGGIALFCKIRCFLRIYYAERRNAYRFLKMWWD